VNHQDHHQVVIMAAVEIEIKVQVAHLIEEVQGEADITGPKVEEFDTLTEES
jgi:methyl coenzyme M reductase subunit D